MHTENTISYLQIIKILIIHIHTDVQITGFKMPFESTVFKTYIRTFKITCTLNHNAQDTVFAKNRLFYPVVVMPANCYTF